MLAYKRRLRLTLGQAAERRETSGGLYLELGRGVQPAPVNGRTKRWRTPYTKPHRHSLPPALETNKWTI